MGAAASALAPAGDAGEAGGDVGAAYATVKESIAPVNVRADTG